MNFSQRLELERIFCHKCEDFVEGYICGYELTAKDDETLENIRNRRKDVCGLDRYLNCTLCNNKDDEFDHIYKDEEGYNILKVTASYNGYIDDFDYGLIEVNYCPICGRKLD